VRADDLAARVPSGGWQQLSCGDGAKGPRFYDWALIATACPAYHLLVRRSLTSNGKGERELAFFACNAPGRHHPCRTGHRSRRAVGGRGMLPGGHAGCRPSAQVARRTRANSLRRILTIIERRATT
jgi:hypothetical protein